MGKQKSSVDAMKTGIASRVVGLRHQRNLNQTQLSELARVPISTLKNIECGATANPHPSTLARLAETLDVDAGWLRTGEGLPTGKV